MGIIFSKPKQYIQRKIDEAIDNTKKAIQTRIDNTKNAINTKIDNTIQGINTRINNVKNGVTSRVNYATNTVVTKVTNAKDAVVNSYVRTRDGIIAVKDGAVKRVTDTCTAVKTRYIITRDATVHAYKTIKNKYIQTKTSCYNKYTASKTRAIDTYTRIRNTKLTRAQKIKYGLLATFILTWMLIGFIILLDLYLGDYKAAEWKIEAVKTFWRYVGYILWELTVNLLFYVKKGGEYTWEGTKICSAYAWEGTKIVADHLWQLTLIIGQHLRYAGEHLLYGASVCGKYIWEGTKFSAGKMYDASVTSLVYIAGVVAKGAHYTKEGAIIAYDYGSYGAKEGAIYLAEGTKQGLINLAIWSYHAAIHLINVTRMCVWGFLTGSYSGTAMLMDGTTFVANKTYHGSVIAINYTTIGMAKSWNATCTTVAFLSHWSIVGVAHLWKTSSETVIYIYESVTASAIFIWESLLAICRFIYLWTSIISDKVVKTSVATSNFVWTWGRYITVNGSKGLYYGVNEFGLRWLYSLSQFIVSLGQMLGAIFVKFFTDLGSYLFNFIYVTFMHIYNLFYFFFNVIYKILSTLMGLVRFKMDGLKYLVQIVFSVIIWFLEKVMIVYNYLLNKYNIYREWLFLGFLAIMTVYCTGLIRDRQESGDSDSEDEDDGDDGFLRERTGSTASKASELPPIYENEELPGYEDSSEDEFHFDADHEMNLDGLADSDEGDLDLPVGKKKADRKSASLEGESDDEYLSDDSLETPSSQGESDRDRMSNSSRSDKTIIKGRKSGSDSDPSKKHQPSEDDIDDLGPERPSESEDEFFEKRDSKFRDYPLHHRVAALLPSTPASDIESNVSTPSDFFAGHDLGTPGSLDTPGSDVSMSVGTPPSDFFAGHDLQSLDSIETPDSDYGVQGASSDNYGNIRRYLGTPSSDIGTPGSDFFDGHHLGTPGSVDTPGSDYSGRSPSHNVDQKGRLIFEHGLEGQSDLDSLDALPMDSPDPGSPVKLTKKDSLKKDLEKYAKESDEDADCESDDPETEHTVRERIDAIKGKKSYKQYLLDHIDSDNIESPNSPMSPMSPGSMDDNQSCDTDSLQNLLVTESDDEADDSLRITSAMSDEICEDSLGEEDDEDKPNDKTSASFSYKDKSSSKVSVTSMPIDVKKTFDNHPSLHPKYGFDPSSKHKAREICETDKHLNSIFDSGTQVVDNQTDGTLQAVGVTSATTHQMTKSDIDNGHGFLSSR